MSFPVFYLGFTYHAVCGSINKLQSPLKGNLLQALTVAYCNGPRKRETTAGFTSSRFNRRSSISADDICQHGSEAVALYRSDLARMRKK